MNWEVILLLSSFVFLSGFALFSRFRHGHLLTPASGLHVQILLFFGLGGFAFIFFQATEPVLSTNEIIHYTTTSCRPLLIGYVIAVALEQFWLRRAPRCELVLGDASVLGTGVISVLVVLGFGGYLLEGNLEFSGLRTIPTYFKALFFPSLLLALINALGRPASGRTVTAVIFFFAIRAGLLSPWRSVLIVLAATILLGVIVTRPRWSFLVAGLGLLLLTFLIPFQNLRRNEFEDMKSRPTVALKQTIKLGMSERFVESGEFAAERLNYVRELVYVNRGVELGLPLQHGKTYFAIIFQLVPRFLWPGKPEMAHWAGYELPRQIGLLQDVDEITSWAVNMFAEATYNFGMWCLVWFVPMLFLLAEGIERVLPRIYTTPQAVALANVSFFYFFLERTSVIFAASIAVALLAVLKFVDFVVVSWRNPQSRATKFRLGAIHSGYRRSGRRFINLRAKQERRESTRLR